ncbi:MAG TPA: SMP-30/gluconolactonase/LRE family protein, partial [Polyangiales bacterium]|nr:SMP-30/gluconolactonase/LRE family protein [Polyangiales bacterium]
KLGELFFSDIDTSTAQNAHGPNSQIRRFKPPSTFDVLVASSGSNGMALANDGRLIAATHDIQSLSYFDPVSGVRQSSSLSYQGKHFNSPNDVAVRSDGNIYFTDPDWQLGPRTSETGMLGVYRVAPNGDVSLVDGSLDEPNGIAISPDERTLYVGQRGDNVMAYPIDADGKTGNGKAFANSGTSDGMTIDCAGNVYVALAVTRATSPIGAVGVFSSSGQKLGEITLDQQSTNVAFGGPEQKTLFITAGPSLYSIALNIPGRAY